MKTMKDLERASSDYCLYEDLCTAAGVSTSCPHGFRWTTCLDGCRMNTEQKGRVHFEQKTGDKRYICRGHVIAYSEA